MAGGGGDDHPLCMELAQGRLTFELVTGEMIPLTNRVTSWKSLPRTARACPPSCWCAPRS